MERRRRFSSHSLFLDWHLEQNELCHLCARLSAPAERIGRRFPVQKPLIRAEIEEGQLRRPEHRFGQTRMAHSLDVLAILLHLDAILRECHGFVLDFERPLVNPDRYLFISESSFAVEISILKS